MCLLLYKRHYKKQEPASAGSMSSFFWKMIIFRSAALLTWSHLALCLQLCSVCLLCFAQLLTHPCQLLTKPHALILHEDKMPHRPERNNRKQTELIPPSQGTRPMHAGVLCKEHGRLRPHITFLSFFIRCAHYQYMMQQCELASVGMT